MQKHPWPLHDVRHWLEPGAVVLISSRWQDRNNIMTLGWYTVLEFSPSLVGCMISAGNISFDMIRRSGECVINLPDAAMAE
ncbi:MAG: flavin reductase, partial [Raoultella planticola]